MKHIREAGEYQQRRLQKFLYDCVQRDLFARHMLTSVQHSPSICDHPLLLPVPISYHQTTDKPKGLKHIIDDREKPK